MHNPLNIVFPRVCPGCRCLLQTSGLCKDCWVHLDFISIPFCLKCGAPFPFDGYADLCARCQKSPPFFDSHRSLLRYGALSRKLIFALKHGRDRTIVPLFAQWLVPIALTFPIDLIVPVPLHWTRLSYRCFNQSALMAQAVARLIGQRTDLMALKRIRKTASQGNLKREQRQENMEKAFSAHPCVEGKRVLLMDDVYTTGATLNACSFVLKERGAKAVHAVTLAQVVFHQKEQDSLSVGGGGLS
jgi:ComF family protein